MSAVLSSGTFTLQRYITFFRKSSQEVEKRNHVGLISGTFKSTK